jgi:predicted N-acetyltransferase YhbS
MTTTWQRFTWDLATVPSVEGLILPPYQLRPATEEEEEIVQKVTASAFSMDSGWGTLQSPFVEKIRKQVAAVFEKEPGNALVLLHGARIIGSSVLDPEDGATTNLVTGPCILHEYRSRGLGSQMLQASLATLRQAGLKTAAGVTREKTISARFIYPKFGGTPAAWTSDYEPAPKIAA